LSLAQTLKFNPFNFFVEFLEIGLSPNLQKEIHLEVDPLKTNGGD
jgi:hypothetical protein